MLKKRVLTISLAVLVCAFLFNIVPMFCSDQNRADAADSSFGNFESEYNMTSSNDSKIIRSDSGHTFTIGTGHGADGRVSTVLTSKNTVDFTRDFTLTGELTDTTTPDGFTITFQPNKDYDFKNTYNNTGTSLCVYDDEGATHYAANSLITEVDTYDSSSIAPKNGTNNRTDEKSDLTGKIINHDTIDENTPLVPHLAISTLSLDGTEKLQDARLVNAGGSDKIFSGKHQITVKWEVTDHIADTGIYTVTYDDKTISYGDKNNPINPKTIFGTTTPYLTFTGSIDFGSNNGDGPNSDDPWTFEMKSFEYNEPILKVTETSDSDSQNVSGNEKIKYTINVKNDGNGDAVGVRVRRYMPDYTEFDSVDSSGEYGCINQKEHATWFIKSIPAGGSATLSYTVVVDACHPDNYVIPHKVYYEVTNSTTTPLTNLFQDPANIAG